MIKEFENWIVNHPEYVNLKFQYGNQLFAKENGVYRTQVFRVSYEAYRNPRASILEKQRNRRVVEYTALALFFILIFGCAALLRGSA